MFERDGVADGSRVAEWKNVAQICYQGFLETVGEYVEKTANSDLLNDCTYVFYGERRYCIANDCTYAKKTGTQAVAGGNTRHVEALKQDNPHHQPLYKKNVLNGHGARAAARRVHRAWLARGSRAGPALACHRTGVPRPASRVPLP